MQLPTGTIPGKLPLGWGMSNEERAVRSHHHFNARQFREKKYKGITYNAFKTRLGNHEKDFRDVKYKNATELSKEVWRIKELGGQHQIKWKIISQHPPFNPSSKRCQLCLHEKLEILEHDGPELLNKRSEIISKFRH